MSASASLIPELENVIQNGSQEKRALMLQRIANLFSDGAASFNEDHIGLFDDVLCRLVIEIETKARAELSERLSPIRNAPTQLMLKLANDDDIAVAGPVIAQSQRLDEVDLVSIAKTKGQAHLMAISERTGIGEAVTDECVPDQNGDQVSLWQFYGNVWVLDVSTMWCAPCQKLASGLQEIVNDHEEEGFVYLKP